MSATLIAIAALLIATIIGVGSATVASKLSYRLLGASLGAEKSILQTLGGVIGFAVGAGAMQVGNLAAAVYGPPLAVAWVAAVFLALVGVGKLFIAVFR